MNLTDVSGRIWRSVTLFSLLTLIVPLLYFPKQFGTELARTSLFNASYEMVFYGFIIYLFYRRGSLSQLVKASAACLLFRIVLGAVFGLLISGAYGLDLQLAVTLGASSYLPSVLLHIAITPFILKPLLSQLFFPARERRRFAPQPVAQDNPEAATGLTSIAISKDRKDTHKSLQPVVDNRFTRVADQVVKVDEVSTALPDGDDGFGRAVRYIGEHGSVDLACIVDPEGLSLGCFTRRGADADKWGPLSLLLLDQVSNVLSRGDLDQLEKVDTVLENKRVVVSREGYFSLIVIVERQSDEVLNIRITQALEMIRKYSEERYRELLITDTESTHV